MQTRGSAALHLRQSLAHNFRQAGQLRRPEQLCLGEQKLPPVHRDIQDILGCCLSCVCNQQQVTYLMEEVGHEPANIMT